MQPITSSLSIYYYYRFSNVASSHIYSYDRYWTVAGEESETKRSEVARERRHTHKRPEAAHSHCPVIYQKRRCITFTKGYNLQIL